ncbi:hypothetical protein LCGC14_2420880, partial [marine sediment metagenome]
MTSRSELPASPESQTSPVTATPALVPDGARSSRRSTPLLVLEAMRPKHWIKNAFVSAPLFFTPNAVSGSNVWFVAVGFLAFSMLASAVYCLNDLRDREADRGHPVKKSRPLAAGTVSPAGAIVMMVALLAGAFALALWLAPAVLPVL